jgi:hypothetical protein
MSAAEHEQLAAFEDKEADEQDRGNPKDVDSLREGPIECIDRPLAGVPYSGTEPLPVMRPCWTVEQNPTTAHRKEALRLREEAARHRAQAAALRRAELTACAGLGEDEIAHSPFFHKDDIHSVTAYYEGDELRGVRVRFRAVPGLTVSWLDRAIRCHQARAAFMGYAPSFQPYCPLGAGPAAVEVTAVQGGILVTLRAQQAYVAAALYGRAADLVGER